MMFARHRSKVAVASARPQQQQHQSQSLSPRRRPFLRIARSKTAGSDSEDETQQQQQQPLTEAQGLSAITPTEATEQQPHRRRLDTEDTLRMSNLILPDLMVCLDNHNNTNHNRQDRLHNHNEDNVIFEDNPFLECRTTSSAAAPLDDGPPPPLLPSQEATVVAKKVVVDCATTVSSLGQGSFQMPAVVAAAAIPLQHQQQPAPEQRPGPPQPPVVPKVIYFRVESEVPDWLLVEEEDDTANHSNQAKETVDVDSQTGRQEPLCQQNSHDRDDSGACLTDDDDDTAENHHPPTTAAVSPLRPFRPRLSFGARLQKGPPPLPFPAPPLSGSKQQQQQQAVPSNKKKKKKELQVQQQDDVTTLAPALSPVWTDVPSPANNLRPTMGRFKSMSSSSLFPSRTPKNLKHRHSHHQGASIPPQTGEVSPSTPDTAIAVAAVAVTPDTSGILTQQKKKKNNQAPTPQETPAEAVVLPAAWAKVPPTPISPNKLPPSSAAAAAATRKSHHKRILSNEGSLLGHNSLWTASTVASSSHTHSNPQPSEAPLSSSSLAHARRTSAVVQELRSAWTKVVGPPPSPGAGVDAKVVSEWEWMQQQHHSAHGCWT